jgi:hypothetical protein
MKIHYDIQKHKQWQISCNAKRTRRNQTHNCNEVTCKWCLRLICCPKCNKPRSYDRHLSAWWHKNDKCPHGFKTI